MSSTAQVLIAIEITPSTRRGAANKVAGTTALESGIPSVIPTGTPHRAGKRKLVKDESNNPKIISSNDGLIKTNSMKR